MSLTNQQIAMMVYCEVFGDITLDTKKEQDLNMEIINDCMSFDCETSVTDTLYSMFDNGPLYDGDVPSKQQRDLLLNKDYCSKVIVNGEDGFNACTYKGRALRGCLKEKYRIRRLVKPNLT